jgi:pyrimidine deaminase RibD-like protein
MRASDFEISNYDKLDTILSRLCKLVERGQESEKDYGMVAACVLDPSNRVVAGLNYPGKDGLRVHAERAAMEAYNKKHGDVPEGSIIITTLSPCNEDGTDMARHRYGSSCTDYINQTVIKKVYCGYIDPSQTDDTRQFNLMETSDKSIRQQCKQFADTFLDNKITEARRKKKKKKSALYGPGPYGLYGVDSGYSGVGDGGVEENFADGRNPQDKGDSKRHGIDTKASVSSLRKTAKSGGRKGQLAHWLANMKAGRAKKK